MFLNQKTGKTENAISNSHMLGELLKFCSLIWMGKVYSLLSGTKLKICDQTASSFYLVIFSGFQTWSNQTHIGKLALTFSIQTAISTYIRICIHIGSRATKYHKIMKSLTRWHKVSWGTTTTYHKLAGGSKIWAIDGLSLYLFISRVR